MACTQTKIALSNYNMIVYGRLGVAPLADIPMFCRFSFSLLSVLCLFVPQPDWTLLWRQEIGRLADRCLVTDVSWEREAENSLDISIKPPPVSPQAVRKTLKYRRFIDMDIALPNWSLLNPWKHSVNFKCLVMISILANSSHPLPLRNRPAICERGRPPSSQLVPRLEVLFLLLLQRIHAWRYPKSIICRAFSRWIKGVVSMKSKAYPNHELCWVFRKGRLLLGLGVSLVFGELCCFERVGIESPEQSQIGVTLSLTKWDDWLYFP